ncbi:MAG: response regulator [Alphaproteobacteria bacterium]|nr:response regulator [Alphaproteobacteria bacterium]USO08365.1 MAG: response regulator [Rhodospirillales bacterium]
MIENKVYDAVHAMVVEDQQDIRSVVREILKDIGVGRVTEVQDGRSALNIMEAEELSPINFIVCDWNMPRMNGIDFLKQVRSIFPRLPFLMITGRSDVDSVVEARDAGVTAYIRKPFTPAQLSAKIGGLLRQANAKVAV